MLADQCALTCPFIRSEDCVHDGPATPPSTAVAMDVDEGAQWSTALQRPLSSPRELRVAGKRRRLNDVDDKDQRELAELLQLIDEDKAGTLPLRSGHPRPAPSRPSSSPCLCTSAHHFRCMRAAFRFEAACSNPRGSVC